MLSFIDPARDNPVPCGSTRAIVTLVLGDDYRAVWERACRYSWEIYAERHGYDVLVITAPLDGSARARARSPAWQKLLVLDQPWSDRYERIVWLDADIIISDVAMDVLYCAPDPEKIGICQVGAQLSADEKHIFLERLYDIVIDPLHARDAWAEHIAGQFGQGGIDGADRAMFNTGVIAASPRHHQGLFKAVYAGEQVCSLYEQPLLSLAVGTLGLVQPLSARFNWGVNEYLTMNFPGTVKACPDAAELRLILSGLQTELGKAYFLHFAGSMPMLRIVADLLSHVGAEVLDRPAQPALETA